MTHWAVLQSISHHRTAQVIGKLPRDIAACAGNRRGADGGEGEVVWVRRANTSTARVDWCRSSLWCAAHSTLDTDAWDRSRYTIK